MGSPSKQQQKYEAKKAKLKAIRAAWSDRLRDVRMGRAKDSHLDFGELLDLYTNSQVRITHYILTSIAHAKGYRPSRVY